jgi:hypothetical protein
MRPALPSGDGLRDAPLDAAFEILQSIAYPALDLRVSAMRSIWPGVSP